MSRPTDVPCATKQMREAKKLLDVSGLEYELRHRSKHIQVAITGKVVMVLSKGNESSELGKLRSHIRAALRTQ